MNSRVEIGKQLERTIHFHVPAQKVDEMFRQVAQQYQKQAHLKGFRPGRAPLNLIKKNYFPDILQSVTNRLIKSSFAQGVEEHQLQVAGEPDFHFDWPQESQDFQFSATIEVFPKIEQVQTEQLPAKKKVVNVTEEQIESSLNRIRNNLADWVEVTRSAQVGDRVIISFVGYRADASESPFTELTNYPLELGSQQFIPGFEEGLVGKAPNENVTLNLTFPADYHQKDLANQPARFEVTVNQVQEKRLPELDEQFCQKLGKSTIEEVRAFIKEQLQKEQEAEAQKLLENSLLESLVKQNPIPLPVRLIREQKKLLTQKIRDDLEQRRVPESEQDAYLQRHDQEIESLAAQQIHQDFLVFEIAGQKNLYPTASDLEKYFSDTAAKSGVDLEKVKQYFAQESRYNNLINKLTYEKVLQFLLERAKIETVS